MKKRNILRTSIVFVLVALFVFLLPAQVVAQTADEAQTSADGQVIQTENGRNGTVAQQEEKPAKILAEINGKRGRFTKHFRLDNGSFMAVQYEYPVHYQDAEGNWVEYDNTLQEKQAENTRKEATQTQPNRESVSQQTASEGTFYTDKKAPSAENERTTENTDGVLQKENNTTPQEQTQAAPDAILSTHEEANGTEYAPKRSNLDIRLSDKAKKNNMVQIQSDGYQVSWGYTGINKSRIDFVENNQMLSGNEKFTVRKNLVSQAFYKDVYPNVDMQYFVTPAGVKENIILKDKSAQTEFFVEYKLTGLTAVQKNIYSIELQNKQGEPVYEIAAPFMRDANGEISTQLTLTIKEQKNNRLKLLLSGDQTWLQAEGRCFPVTVDPTFITSQSWGAVECTYINQNEPNTAYGYGSSSGYTGTVYAGTLGGNKTYRSFIKIKNLPDLNKGDVVVDAKINLHVYQNSFYDTMYIGAYQVKENWTQSTLTWNNRPNFYANVVDYDTFVEDDPDVWHKWNVTTSVKKWYNGEENYGIMLKPLDEANNYQCASFYSANYPASSVPRPVFEITYRNNKGLEDYWTYTSFEAGTAGTVYINDYTGNLVFIHGDMSTPGGRMPVNVQHVFNNYMANEKFSKIAPYVGVGWRMNIQQTLLPSSQFGLTGDAAATYPYVYTDGDGTDHYFYKKTENGKTKYYDEDGLKLELTIQSSSTNEKYKITDEDDNTLVFNANGNLVKMLDANGNAIALTLSADKKSILSVKDGAGKPIAFAKQSYSYITQMTDPAGRIKKYTYTGNRLTKIKNPDGTEIHFTYDSDGSITSITDIDGYKISFTYTANTRGKQVASVQEYGTDGTAGQKITFDRSRYNTTLVKSAGVDGVFDNTDDLTTTYQFDQYGRTTSVKSKTGNRDLGAAGCTYTSGTVNANASNLSQINRVSADHAVGSNAVNLLKNHNFESAVNWSNAEWIGDNTYTMAYTTAQRYLGRQSLKLNVTQYTGDSRARAYQDLASTELEPGVKYTVSGYIKTKDVASAAENYGALIGVTSFNSDNTTTDFLSEHIKGTTDASINNGWRRVSLTFTVPENSSKSRIQLALRAATGTAYFDAVQVEQYNVPNTYNMLENASFEKYTGNLPTGWAGNALTVANDADFKDATQYRHGAYSFRIRGDAEANKELYQSVPVSGSENDTYIVSGWARANAVPENNDNTRRFKISIQVKYTDGTSVWKLPAEFNRSISDWQFASAAFNLSDETSANKTPSAVVIYLRYHQQANTAYFDNIQLIKDVAQSYTYNEDGELVTVEQNADRKSNMEYSNADLTKYIDAKGYDYQYTYDGKHNMTRAVSQNKVSYNYTYNAQGNPTALAVKTQGGSAAIKASVAYTSNGAFVNQATDQDGNAVTYHYSQNTGTLSSATDSSGTVTYSYNADNNLLTGVSKELEEEGYTASNTYAYTAETSRNLEKITHNGTEYNIEYDAYNNKTASRVGGRLLARNSYHANNGLLSSVTYGTGRYVTYAYDAFGNIATQNSSGKEYNSYSDRTGAVIRHEDSLNGLLYDSEYDTTGRLVRQSAQDTGKAQTSDRSVYALEYGYDLNNNVTKLINITPHMKAENTYEYEKDNLPRKHTIDGGKNITYTYDGLNRLTKTTLNTTEPLEISYVYELSDRNEEGEDYYRTTKVRTESIGAATYRYSYDDMGNITKQEELVNGVYVIKYTYQYDSLNQLVYEKDHTENVQHTYAYDEGGNLDYEIITQLSPSGIGIGAETINYGYGDNSWKDKMTSYDGQSITYDAIGNPISYRDGMSMTWENGRQLKSLTQGGNTISYTYDAGGVRMSKSVNGEKWTYQYVGGKLLHETRGEKEFAYFYDANGFLSAIKYKLTPTGTEQTYYAAHNWRGDVTGLYNASGTRIASYEYDSWGKVISIKGLSGNEVTSENHIGNLNKIRYRGYYQDTETGFYYLMSRYYDPVTHRFLNADGYFQTGQGVLDTNMSAYCANNPVNYFDPTGTITAKQIQYELAFNHDTTKYTIADALEQQKREYYANMSVWQKIGESATALFLSPGVTFSLGYGLGVQGKLSEAIDVSLLVKAVPIEITLSPFKSDMGVHTYEGIGISGFGMDFTAWDNHQYTSYFDDSKDYSSEAGNVPNRISIVGAEAFVIIGGSVDIYIDGDYLTGRLSEIWGW